MSPRTKLTTRRCPHGILAEDLPLDDDTEVGHHKFPAHQKRCRNARPFSHRRWGRIVHCCATCGRRWA